MTSEEPSELARLRAEAQEAVNRLGGKPGPAGMPEEVGRFLAARSAAFGRATGRKGMPMTYGGGGKEPRRKK